MIYDKNGKSLNIAYDKNGVVLTSAYDKNGTLIYSSSASNLKIMTYNVGQWYIGNGSKVPTDKKSVYHDLQYGTFLNNSVDVLFLQEYLNEWCADGSLSSELLDPFFDNQEVTNPRGYIGHSICTNGYTLSDYTSHDFTTNRGNYPTYESAEITIDGKTITIVNTHNDYTEPYKTQDITDLLGFLATLDSFILAGDFNMGIYANTSPTSDNYRLGVNVWKEAGYNVGNCNPTYLPTYSGTTSMTDGGAADQIITSSDISISNVYTYNAKLTDDVADKIDHIPLIAELVIN